MLDRNPGAQERPTLVRLKDYKTAPLRTGKKEETLGRATTKRTGRSLLFGITIVMAAATAAGLVYTWERLKVETMLEENLALEKKVEEIRSSAEALYFEVATLEASGRIEKIATERLGMKKLNWENVVIVRDGGRNK